MSIQGSLSGGLLWLLRKRLAGVPEGVRLLLIKITFSLYIVPLIYPMLVFSRYLYLNGMWVRTGEFGMNAPDKLEEIVHIAGGIWVLGLIAGMLISGYRYVRFRRILRANIQVVDETWGQVVTHYFEKHQLKGVRVYQNMLAATTFVTGVIRPKIILPEKHYTEKQIIMMIEHEVHHIRCHDLFWKQLAMFISWLHWFNPLVYWLGRELSEEQEIDCDLAVCDTNPQYTVGEYCQFLYDEQVTNVDSAFAAALTETKSSLERRIEEMFNRKKYKKWTRKMRILCGLAFVLAMVAPMYAMADGVISLDTALRVNYEVATEVEPLEPEEVFYAMDDGTVQEVHVGEETMVYSSVVNVDHTIPANTRYLYQKQQMAVGDRVTITVDCADAEVTFRIGIKNVATGEMAYSEGKDLLAGTFVIEEAGEYYSFVQNCSKQDADFFGTIMYP